MLRLFCALMLAASVAVADSPPDRPLPLKPAPAKSAGLTVVAVNVKDGAIVSEELVQVPVVVTEKVTVIENGQQVTKDVNVTRVVTQTVVRQTKLKDLKATGTDGKAIPADELEKKLKDGGMVVMLSGKLDADLRKVFKDGTVFVEHTPPEVKPAPPGTGGPAQLPPNPK